GEEIEHRHGKLPRGGVLAVRGGKVYRGNYVGAFFLAPAKRAVVIGEGQRADGALRRAERYAGPLRVQHRTGGGGGVQGTVEQSPHGVGAVRGVFLAGGDFPGVEPHQVVELVAVWTRLVQQVGTGQIVEEPARLDRAGHRECRGCRAADAGSWVQGKQPEQ